MVFSKRLIFHIILSLVLYSAANSAYSDNTLTHNTNNHPNSSHYHINNITLIGTSEHQKKFLQWLNKIAEIQKGQEILLSIFNTPHTLIIEHSPIARMSAGRTIAPVTENLINGVGAGVKIIFDAEIPEEGTHRVFDTAFELIEFTATQNLFHELAHAKHQMNGTWLYFNSEKQAIEEENIFRKQESQKNNTKITQRYDKSGFAIGSKEEKRIIAFRLRSQAAL